MFVLAVGHILRRPPRRRGDDVPAQRLLFLAGSVPAGVAAVAIAPASTGDGTASR